MMTTINGEDWWTGKALAIFAGADQWLKCRTRGAEGPAFAVPSQAKAGLYHLVDVRRCSCQDFQRRQRPCKHLLAVRLDVALLQAAPRPARAARPAVAPQHLALSEETRTAALCASRVGVKGE